MKRRFLFRLLIVAALLAGCASPGLLPESPSFPKEAEGPLPPKQERVIKTARSLLGAPYRFGGGTPKGFDCSGFVTYVFRNAAGLFLPRVSHDLARSGRPVGVAELRPADLVYFKIEFQRSLHVGIYLGNGRFIHAPSSRGKVNVQNLSLDYWKKRFRGARRVLL